MSGFVCQICGEVHDEMLMDIAFQRPDVIFKIPDAERDDHSRCSNDLCQTRDDRYFIRGILEVPVVGLEADFRWGPWVEVSRDDFDRYIELWDVDDVASEPPFPGRLANELAPYSGCEGLELTVRLHPTERPRFIVRSLDHPLGRDQHHGMTPQQLHDILARYGWTPGES